MKGKERIGLFGGSFDPIHTGHLILAEVAMDFVGLERVIFIPTAFPPNKRDRALTDFELRAKMVELAIEDNPRFEISLIEGHDRVAYTFESVLRFKNEGFSKEQIHLLIGSDSLEEIETWKNPDIIFSNATIVALMRPGHHGLSALPEGTALVVIETGSNSISSGEIRELVKEDRSIRYLVPRIVESFIIDHSLYRETT